MSILTIIITSVIFALGFTAGRMDRDVNRVWPLSADDIRAMLRPSEAS